jgi:hypothetical protein
MVVARMNISVALAVFLGDRRISETARLGGTKMLVPPPPKHGLHRRAFLQTLTSALLVATPSLPALAAYTIVPTGSIADKQARQLEVAKELKVTPDDPYLFGESAQLEFDIAKLENNTKFVNRVRPRVESGEQRFSTRLSVPVPDMAVAVTFWTAGCGALLLDTRIVDGRNVTRIGYGPESLRKDDGGKFSLELIESAEPSQMGAEDAVVQYIQLGIPVFRLSRVMATGGEIVSAYGGMACQECPADPPPHKHANRLPRAALWAREECLLRLAARSNACVTSPTSPLSYTHSRLYGAHRARRHPAARADRREPARPVPVRGAAVQRPGGDQEALRGARDGGAAG